MQLCSTMCDKKFSSSKILRTHYRRIHEKKNQGNQSEIRSVETPFHCTKCDKKYASYKALWNHQKQIHKRNQSSSRKCSITVKECKKCGEIPQVDSSSYSSSEMKYRIPDSKEILAFICNICNGIFKNMGSLTKHIIKHCIEVDIQ